MDERQINQGDIYWLNPQNPQNTEAVIAHPHVVIHADSESVTVCALTSNLNKVTMPGNLLLEIAEGNLSRQSVVEVSKVLTVPQEQVGEYIGTLSQARVKQIFAGIRFVQTSFFSRH